MITQIEERYRWSSPTKMIHILVSLITCLFATLLILILNVPICYISSQSSNKDKNEALKPLNILILGKGMMDLVSRVLIFFIFMIVHNNGQFSPGRTLTSFYTMVGIMTIFNIVFNERRNFNSSKYWLGKIWILFRPNNFDQNLYSRSSNQLF